MRTRSVLYVAFQERSNKKVARDGKRAISISVSPAGFDIKDLLVCEQVESVR